MKKSVFMCALAGVSIPALMARAREMGTQSFGLENGQVALGRHFADVRLERYPNELRVTELEPLVAYLESLWSLDQMVAAVAPTAEEQAALRARVVEAFRALAGERLAADGVIVITKQTGAFVARP